ncbi:phage portal protein [Agathobaculum sp. NTUH-O15-33]|uniref:phage portal protein n=1 Tax=Agathobaculum sp. NTUH-O15-33 TaxID=3079302 RepID=UPI0029587964|nr:phage portal protein [Agathobaculum sp. NTUH-O15-33]WNX85247.1 phage portal protein [Agathobaculum sp. NTUH-O15-33]
MGLNFKRWLLEKLGGDQARVTAEDIAANKMLGLSAEIYVRELAFWQCVNLIANAVSKCEFKTFQGGKETKGEEYYRWNVEPNKNQNSSVFMQKMISKLFANNEVLVIEANGQLLIADSYSRKEYALLEDVFEQITVGTFRFDRTFVQSDVLFISLHSHDMRPLVNGLYETYKALIDYGVRSYNKSRGMKGVISLDAIIPGDQSTKDALDTLKNNGYKDFASAENAVMTLGRGMTYTDLGSKTYSNEGTRDIRAMIDDVSDFTARAFGVPPALLSGDVQGVSDALDQFLTFCIDPLCDMIGEEINRKLYGKEMLHGDYLRIDTKCVKHVDLLSVSTAIDKLIASGAFSINDIRDVVGEPPIDEPWANQHFMTKNYSTVQDLLEALNQNLNPETG